MNNYEKKKKNYSYILKHIKYFLLISEKSMVKNEKKAACKFFKCLNLHNFFEIFTILNENKTVTKR